MSYKVWWLHPRIFWDIIYDGFWDTSKRWLFGSSEPSQPVGLLVLNSYIFQNLTSTITTSMASSTPINQYI